MNVTQAQNDIVTPRSSVIIENQGWRAAWNKSIFLLWCWISFLLLFGIGILSYFLIFPRLVMVDQWLFTYYGFSFYLPVLVATLAGIFFFILGSGLILLTVTSLTGIDLLYPHFKRSITVSILFPIAAFLAQLLGINRNTLRTSFVKVNNSLTIAQRKRIHGDRILILLPHCLQIDVCQRKLTSTVYNCIQCGKCPVGSLLELGTRYNLTIEVVNGGTEARRRVSSFKPSGIVAIACERDLTFGIQDVYPIPVYGVINDRPHGPCLNTCVDMALLEEAIHFFKKQ